jgi:tetratricopeptide (TPR) repeat protein
MLSSDQVPGVDRLLGEMLVAIRGYLDKPAIELRSIQLMVESHLQFEDWGVALDLLAQANPLLDVVGDERATERFRRAKGIALRNVGHTREAVDELQSVFKSQLGRDAREAVVTLPNLVEAIRELGDFDKGLEFITQIESQTGRGGVPRDRLRLALWRGILNKNLMQDAIQFRWDTVSGRFVPAPEEARRYRQRAEDALAKALAIGATDKFDGVLGPDIVQSHSELAETALWYTMLDRSSLAEADLRLEALGRLLALRPALEPEVEYHRYLAQRAALDRRFDDAKTSLARARRLAHANGMRFLESDCTLDWARFIANDITRFNVQEIEAARKDLKEAVAYYDNDVGKGTYYPRILRLLLGALDRALAGEPTRA